MTHATGGIAASPTDPLDAILACVEDPGRLDETKRRLSALGLVTSTARGLEAAGKSLGSVTTEGTRTVLYGDSMTDTTDTIVANAPGVYNTMTGDLTLTVASHQQAPGWVVGIWNRSQGYPVQNGLFTVPVQSVPDVNSFVVNIGAGRAIATNNAEWRYRPRSWRSAQGMFTWLQAFSGQRFNVVHNGAASGDTVQDCLDRFEGDCAAFEPQTVIMQMPGINDTGSGNGNLSEDTIAGRQQVLIDKILALGARLILLSTTPPAPAEARSNLLNMARVQRLNRRLRDYCASRPGVIFFDAHRRIVNPESATGSSGTTASAGTPNAGLIRSADNIHYSMRGARKIAQELWTQIGPAFPTDMSTLPTSSIDNFWSSAVALTGATRAGGVVTGTIVGGAPGVQVGERLKLVGGTEALNEYVTLRTASGTSVSFVTSGGADGALAGTIRLSRSRNLQPNPLLTTAVGGGGFAGAGSSAGSFAANIRVENLVGAPAHVGSVVARSDGYGNDQQVVITPSAAGQQVAISSDFQTYATDLPAMVRAGRTYVGELALSLSGVAGSTLSEIRYNLEFTVGGVVYQAYALNGYADGAVLNSDLPEVHLRTAPLLMPAGAVGQCKWRVVLVFTGAGGDLTVRIGRIRLEEQA